LAEKAVAVLVYNAYTLFLWRRVYLLRK